MVLWCITSKKFNKDENYENMQSNTTWRSCMHLIHSIFFKIKFEEKKYFFTVLSFYIWNNILEIFKLLGTFVIMAHKACCCKHNWKSTCPGFFFLTWCWDNGISVPSQGLWEFKESMHYVKKMPPWKCKKSKERILQTFFKTLATMAGQDRKFQSLEPLKCLFYLF